MGLFQRNQKKDLKLLKDSYQTLLDDFCSMFGFDLGTIAEHRPDEVDAVEYYLFLGGFVLACYASFKKRTDVESMKVFALSVIAFIVREVYKKNSQGSSKALADKHFDRLADLLEERQDECIEFMVRAAFKPSGEGDADKLAARASELIFRGRQRGVLQLSSFFMKHFSKFSKIFS